MRVIQFEAKGDGVNGISPVQIEVLEFSRSVRAKKTLMWFGIFLGLGGFSALIPVVHFVAVPLFALLALGSLVVVPLNRDQIVKAETQCPYCHKATKLQRPSLKPPFRDSCEHCHQLIYIDKGS